MLFRRLVLATAIALSGCSAITNVPPSQRRAIIVSFDGSRASVIHRMIAEGAMPNLARVVANGASAAYSRTNFPSKTPCGHAALWTGTFGNVNGITGKAVPKLPAASHTLLDTWNGFDSRALLAEPIWATAARQGKRVLVLQSTQETPFKTYEPGGTFGGPYTGSLGMIDGFAGIRGNEGVYDDPSAWHTASGWAKSPQSDRPLEEAALRVGVTTLWALAYGDPQNPTVGYDTVRLATSKDATDFDTLTPAAAGSGQGWSRALPMMTKRGHAMAFFRLFALDPALHGWLLYHTPPTEAQSNKPELATVFDGDNPFIPAGAIDAWAAGDLGKTMYQGGDGTAEARYLDTVAFMIARMQDRARIAFARKDWDMLVSYVPIPDECEHHWFGTVDRDSPSYDPKLAPRVWKLIAQECHLADDYIGTLYDGGGANTDLAIASDHGFAGLKYYFYPNTILREAGLLKLDARGQVDLAHTLVFYPPGDGNYLVVNRKTRLGGIVPESQVASVLARAQKALAAVKAENGKPLLTEFLRPSVGNFDLGIGGPTGGDLYLDYQPGYYPEPDLNRASAFKLLPPGTGSHIFDPRREDMHTIQFYVGPGVKRGVTIGAVRNSDLAPTICQLLGIARPPQATGRVLHEALTQ
ncbi:MAG TPA: alkaline phosphatase family protein [Oscillatoriaceae cyanobacterium]